MARLICVSHPTGSVQLSCITTGCTSGCCKYVNLSGSWEERLTDVHLNQDTAQTPHVNCHVIRSAEQHLRRPVEPTLNVLVDLYQTTSHVLQPWVSTNNRRRDTKKHVSSSVQSFDHNKMMHWLIFHGPSTADAVPPHSQNLLFEFHATYWVPSFSDNAASMLSRLCYNAASMQVHGMSTYTVAELTWTAKVDDLDGTALGVTEENVLRLEVTVDDL